MIKREMKILGVKVDLYSQLALFCLLLIVITGLFSNFIANDRPVIIGDKDGIYFPVFSKKFEQKWSKHNGVPFNWSEVKNTKFGWPIIPYAPGESDRLNSNYKPPFAPLIEAPSECYVGKGSTLRYRHWLGTNLKGEDLLSGLIHGTSVSLKIGFFSILLAVIIGTILGMVAGFYQNDSWKVPLLSLAFMLFSIIPSFYFADLFAFFAGEYLHWKDTWALIGMFFIYASNIFMGLLLSYWVGKMIHSVFKWKKKVYVPVDTIVSRIIEVFAAIPKLMLVIALAAILERSVTNVILVIGICAWAGIARLVRGEVLKIRNTDFITSAKALGLSNFKIIAKHVLPNIAGPILVTFVFGLSSAILIESGLSFLNIGVPENVITWGQLLADGKQNFNAWWMIAFPGFAIFITVLCLNVLGEKFKSVLSPSNRGFS